MIQLGGGVIRRLVAVVAVVAGAEAEFHFRLGFKNPMLALREGLVPPIDAPYAVVAFAFPKRWLSASSRRRPLSGSIDTEVLRG